MAEPGNIALAQMIRSTAEYLTQAAHAVERGQYDQANVSLRVVVAMAESLTLAPKLPDMPGRPGEQNGRLRRLNQTSTTSQQFKREVLGVFRGLHQPVQLRDLMAALESSGVAIPGQGKPANLISYLKRWPEVTNPGYGWYETV